MKAKSKAGVKTKAKKASVAKKKVRAKAKKVSVAKKKERMAGGEYDTYKYVNHGGILVQKSDLNPVPVAKLNKGLERAKRDIKKLLSVLTVSFQDYSITQIQFSISFDAEGKFLGIGVGGSTSVTVTAEPKV
jgi:hypothetical protein